MAEKKTNPSLSKILTPRGEWLVRSHQLSQGTSINHGQPVGAIRKEDGTDIVVHVGELCPTCNCRIRGLNHMNGDHHNKRVYKKR